MNNDYLNRAKKAIPDAQILSIVAAKRARQLALGTVVEVHVPDPECEAGHDISRALADSRDLAASCIGVRLVKQPGDAARGTKNDRVVEVVLAGLVDAVDAIVGVVHAVVWCRPGARQGIDCECHGIGIGDEVFD